MMVWTVGVRGSVSSHLSEVLHTTLVDLSELSAISQHHERASTIKANCNEEKDRKSYQIYHATSLHLLILFFVLKQNIHVGT
jgi:hypothetical protein